MNQEKKGFLAGKGFYAVLFLCILAVAASGYVIFSGEDEAVPPATEIALEEKEIAKPAETGASAPEKVERESEKPVRTDSPGKEESTEVSAEPGWQRPVVGPLARSYSGDALVYNPTLGDWRTHDGVDIACAVGTEVKAIGKGVVTRVGEDGLTGVSVTVEHAGGYTATYSNLDPSVPCRVGDEVNAGTVLGKVGESMQTESADAPHLHLEVWKNSRRIDPTALIGD